MKLFKRLIIFILTSLLCGCIVGPNYHRPSIVMPVQYKETQCGDWKIATPCDACDRGEWWHIFCDPQLDALEDRLNLYNQNIRIAIAQYGQARSLVDAARASYFPTFISSAAINRQRQITSNGVTTLGSSSTVATTSIDPVFTTHLLNLDATWEPDFWGAVTRSVQANEAATQASFANVGLVQLSSQALLAQTYFQVRALDTDQKILDETVCEYQKALQLTQNRYRAGVAALADVVQARTQLESAQSLAINNGIARAQSEHAIAVLIGVPPAIFCMPPQPLCATPPKIPIEFPCALLERRPDIAQAERLMAQANEQIGIAISAYYPNLVLTLSGTDQGPNLSHWLSLPDISWALGSQVFETLFDAGLRKANTNQAWANYCATVANYKQTVLAAFQNVEDNLAQLRILDEQYCVQKQAAADAQLALKLVMNQYKAGTVSYSNVIIAQNAALTATKNAADVNGLRMSTAVGLIKALGGGWNVCELNRAVDYTRRKADQRPGIPCLPGLPCRPIAQ